MLEGCQAKADNFFVKEFQPNLNPNNGNRLLRGTREASGPFLKTTKCPNHFNCITRLSVSTSDKILQYMAGESQYTGKKGELYVECEEKNII